MEFLFEYLGFLARAVTIVVAIMIVLGFFFANAGRRGAQGGAEGALEVKHLNRELDDLKAALEGAVVSVEEQKMLAKQRDAAEKKKRTLIKLFSSITQCKQNVGTRFDHQSF